MLIHDLNKIKNGDIVSYQKIDADRNQEEKSM